MTTPARPDWNAIHAAVLQWYAESARDLPWRHSHDPYTILVSEVMLQQTQVDRVIPKFLAFVSRFPTFSSLAEAPTADVIRAWQGLGYNRRAVRLQRAARAVIDRYGGSLPATTQGLMELEGLGRYTASAVACFAFGLPEPVLDTNVRRVLGRVALGPDGPRVSSAGALWRLAEEALPVGHAYAWNQALMDLGARICLESKPMCLVCPLRPWCRSAGLIGPAIRERRTLYKTKGKPRFTGSTRYYRGRIVEYLRNLPSEQSLSLQTLGSQIKPDFNPGDIPWLENLVAVLEREGLVARRADGSVALPPYLAT